MGETHYEILDITKDATSEEIRDAYFVLARKFHPDSNPSTFAQEMFYKIQEAYEVLSNPEKRKAYDSTILEEEKPSDSVTISIEYSSKELPRLNEEQVLYAKVDIHVKENNNQNKNSQNHICFLIDNSTSMKGERIYIVKENIIHLINNLRPIDIISIITFNDKAEVILSPTKVSDLSQIEKKLENITCMGATEIFKGLKAGVDLLSVNHINVFSKQLILLTDGHTYGDEEQCLEFAQKLYEKNIQVNTLGLGSEWNDVFLDKLAITTGGKSSFIRSREDLHEFMEKLASSLKNIFARGMSMDLDVEKNVKINYIYRIQPDIAELPEEKPIPMGDLHNGMESIFLFSFLITPLEREIEEITIGKGKIFYDIQSKKIERARSIINFDISIKDQISRQEVPIGIVNALSKITICRMQEKANMEVKNGQVDNAINRLENISTQLLAQGNAKLAKMTLVEAELLKTNKKYSVDGDKQLKYGTRALMLLPENEKRPQ